MIDEIEPSRPAKAAKAVAKTTQRVNRSETLIGAVQRVREHLPGDRQVGDPLSLADSRHLSIAARQLTEITGTDSGVAHELSGGALQLWRAFLQARGKDSGDVDVTLLFTDLVGFSSWALTVGDDESLRLLRNVGTAVEPAVAAHGGEVVKRLGDGLMAAFPSPQSAYEALVDATTRLNAVSTADGWKPRLRAGLHRGRPRRLGGDYLGIDVNIAARLVERAGAGEILASAAVVDELDPETVAWRRKKTFALLRVKGVPDELDVFVLLPKR